MNPDSPVVCPHSERCGGCALIGLSIEAQHAFKRERVQRALEHYPGLSQMQIDPVTPAQPVRAYRTRAKLVVSQRGEVGLYTRASHDVVDIPDCQVLSPALLHVAGQVRELLAPPQGLSGLDLREVRDGGKAGVLVTLIAPSGSRAALLPLAEQLAASEPVRGVAFSARESDSAQLLGAAPETLFGASAVRDRLDDDGPYHYAAHGGFAQAHRGQAGAIASHVAQQLSAALGGLSGMRVLELYAGAGALSLELSQLGARPLMVERFEPALAHAQRAAGEQSLPVLGVRALDAEVALVELAEQGERFDAVIVNPPRRGLTPRVRARLAELAPRALVYVSCDPDTLARDLADFAQRGLAARELVPYDMMPLAADVESVVVLAPGKPTPLRVIYEDAGLLVIDKPAHLPTVPHPEHGSSVLAQLRAASGPELRAVHRLDLGTSGVCLFAKDGEHVAGWQRALAAGQKHYLALARGRVHAKGIVKQPLFEDGASRDALTRYTRVASLGGHSLVRVRPVQGRTHQVRKHLAAIHHPVLGDVRYGDPASNRHFEHKYGLDRTFLHLSRIELTHPETGEPLVLASELAADLDVVRRQLAASPLYPR